MNRLDVSDCPHANPQGERFSGMFVRLIVIAFQYMKGNTSFTVRLTAGVDLLL